MPAEYPPEESDRAYKLGNKAAKEGKAISANPYRDGTDAASSWAMGYSKAKGYNRGYKADRAMLKVVKVTRDRAGLHIFLDRAVVKVRAEDEDIFKPGDNVHLGFAVKGGAGFKGKLVAIENGIARISAPGIGKEATKEYKGPVKLLSRDAGHMPTARGTQRGIPAKTAEDLRALHGAIRTHKDDCSCAACKGKTRDADNLPNGYEVWYGTGINEGWTAAYYDKSLGDFKTKADAVKAVKEHYKKLVGDSVIKSLDKIPYKMRDGMRNDLLDDIQEAEEYATLLEKTGRPRDIEEAKRQRAKAAQLKQKLKQFEGKSKDSTHPSVMIAQIEEQIRKKRYETPAELEDLKRQLAAEKEKLKKTGPLKDEKPCGCQDKKTKDDTREGWDREDYILAIKETEARIDKMIKSGAKILRNDPLSVRLDTLRREMKLEAWNDSKPSSTKDAQVAHLNLAGVNAAMKAGGYDDQFIQASFVGMTASNKAKYSVTYKVDNMNANGKATVFIWEENGRFIGDY